MELIKILDGNLVYVLNSIRHVSLLAQLKSHSYREVIAPQNWVSQSGITAKTLLGANKSLKQPRLKSDQ
jgi:hypothetical protein